MICQIVHKDMGTRNIRGKCGNILMDQLILPWHLNTSWANRSTEEWQSPTYLP